MKPHISCLTFLAIVIGIYALTDEQIQKRRQNSEECNSYSGVTQEMINEAKENTTWFDDRNFSGKYKKYSHCLLKKEGFINESGDLVIDTIKTTFRQASGNDKMDKIVEECAVKKDTPEETAYQFMVCVRKLQLGSRS